MLELLWDSDSGPIVPRFLSKQRTARIFTGGHFISETADDLNINFVVIDTMSADRTD